MTRPTRTSRYCIGIDLGGTYVKFVLLDEKTQASGIFQLETPQGRDGVVAQMINGARKLLVDQGVSHDQVVGVGIGSPGPLDIETGTLISLANLPGLENLPIRDVVSAGLDLPAVLENDANAAAYGEFLCGSGKGTRHMVLLTLGTGVGSGIIIDGKLLHGAHGIGGELGHMIVEPSGQLCGCGQVGCLECYGSAVNVAQIAADRIEKDGRTGLLAAVLKQTGSITSQEICETAAAGDEFAKEIWSEAVRHIALACVSISRIFDPDKIIIGGGMAKSGDFLLKPVSRQFNKLHWRLTDVKTKIRLAKLGNDAGAIGAAGVAWSAFG